MWDHLILAVVAFPLAGAILTTVLSARPSTRRYTAPVAVAAAGLMLLAALGLRENTLVRLPLPRLEPAALFGSTPAYLADRLARSFLLLLGLTGLGGLVASADASARRSVGIARHQGAALLLLAGSASLVLSANLLTAYLSWCFLDLAMLVTVVLPEDGQDRPVGPALRTLVFNQLAGLAVLLAAVQAQPGTGALPLDLGRQPDTAWLLLLAGLARAGLYPLHLGLPLVAGGPAWRASLLRLLPTASGLYLVMRVVAGAGGAAEGLSVVSGLSLVLTGLLAWLAPDEEHTLAYVTAHQVSLVVLSLTLDHPQTDVAALAATLNLMLSVNLLFLTGSLSGVATAGRAARRGEYRTTLPHPSAGAGNRPEASPRGSARRDGPQSERAARWMRRLWVVAVAAVVGVPPALGFVGRWGLYRYAVEQGLWLLLAGAALGSSFVFASLLPLLQPAEGEALSRPGRALNTAVIVLGAPFIVLGLQPLLLSPILGALGGPDTYQMLLKLVRTTEQSVGVAGMAAILLPLAIGYGLDQVQRGATADLQAATSRVFRLLGLGWLHRMAWTGSGRLARLARSAVEPLEGERYLAWALLLGLLVILLLARYA